MISESKAELLELLEGKGASKSGAPERDSKNTNPKKSILNKKKKNPSVEQPHLVSDQKNKTPCMVIHT